MDRWFGKHALGVGSQAGVETALLGLVEALGLGAQGRGSGTALVEVAAESGRKERSEDDLGAAVECQTWS